MSTEPVTIDQSELERIANELGVTVEQVKALQAVGPAPGPPPASPDPSAWPTPPEAAPAPEAPVSVTEPPALALPPIQPAPEHEAQATKPVELPPITHSEPILTYGAAGDIVEKLVRLLAVNGYHNTSFANGTNPARVLDNSIMGEVKRFAEDHHVANDLAEFAGLSIPATKLVGEHVGPYIWQALLDGAKLVLTAV